MELKVCYDDNPMWYTGDKDNPSGSLIDLIYFVSKEANFNFSLQEVKGLWTHLLMTEECDIVIGGNILHQQISFVFYYTPGFYTSNVVIMSKNVSEKNFSTSIDVNVEMLAGIAVCIVVLSTVTFIAEKCSRSFLSDASPGTFLNIFWMYYSSLVLQGEIKPRIVCLTSKLLYWMWSLVLVFILSGIGGNLKADLVASKELQINTLQDVLDQTQMKAYICFHQPVHFYFQFDTTPIASSLFKRMIKQNTVLDQDTCDHLDEVVKGKAVLIEDEVKLVTNMPKYCTEKRKRKLYMSSEPIFRQEYCIFMHDNVDEEMREIINKKVTYFSTTMQLMPRVRYNNFKAKDCLDYETPDGPVRVDALLFCTWVIGMALSTASLIIEIAVFRFSAIVHKYDVHIPPPMMWSVFHK